MRKRIEDLGRICVMIDDILDLDVWDLYSGRKKDFTEYFEDLCEQDRDDLLHNLIYGLEGVKDKLYKVSEIAEGTDRLNECNEGNYN